MLKFLMILCAGFGGAFLAAALHPQCFHSMEALACGGEPSFGTYTLGFFGGLLLAAVVMAVMKVFDAL